ncbi:hypothetical protein V495_03134 [Pseudogymnoascus sp. VKM F-4514 (FW-929)]|jgi:hypothetical protein|nr:hypothetical protein V490_02735 [Pseudogymnoascus sp. VKM F-3557]KFY45076.1 hypothetical protein V495_03134 [Pseudogymnoascus sp. VKM F-4514 (FW-929)]KFY60806.1 hypothetical protein V497_03354 [Pseudogymnoascus sp. VKM F-4516 (FW-969)]
MRASVLLLAAATVAVASAESVELFGAGDEGGEHYEFLASSLGSDSTATTYILGCPTQSANEENCVFMTPVIYAIGPKTVEMKSYAGEQELTVVQNCQLEAKTSAACTVHYDGPGTSAFENDPEATDALQTKTIVETGKAAETAWGTVPLVTDVASIYNAAKALSVYSAGGASDGPAPTGTDGSSAPATTGSGVTSAPTSTPTGTNTGAVETSESTGAMAQITGSCGWAVGGVAAAVALAAL